MGKSKSLAFLGEFSVWKLRQQKNDIVACQIIITNAKEDNTIVFFTTIYKWLEFGGMAILVYIYIFGLKMLYSVVLCIAHKVNLLKIWVLTWISMLRPPFTGFLNDSSRWWDPFWKFYVTITVFLSSLSLVFIVVYPT